MMNFTELPRVPSDHLVPVTDPRVPNRPGGKKTPTGLGAFPNRARQPRRIDPACPLTARSGRSRAHHSPPGEDQHGPGRRLDRGTRTPRRLTTPRVGDARRHIVSCRNEYFIRAHIYAQWKTHAYSRPCWQSSCSLFYRSGKEQDRRLRVTEIRTRVRDARPQTGQICAGQAACCSYSDNCRFWQDAATRS